MEEPLRIFARAAMLTGKSMTLPPLSMTWAGTVRARIPFPG